MLPLCYRYCGVRDRYATVRRIPIRRMVPLYNRCAEGMWRILPLVYRYAHTYAAYTTVMLPVCGGYAHTYAVYTAVYRTS